MSRGLPKLKCAAIAVLLVWAIFSVSNVGSPPIDTSLTPDTVELTDIDLYVDVAEGVASGSDYYETAAQLHRERNYPLQPFYTVRLPTLALFQSVVPARVGALALAFLAILVWIVRLPGSVVERAVAAVAMTSSAFLAVSTEMAHSHDLWSGLLLTLALGLYTKERWLPTVLLAALAVSIREHALLFGAIFGAFALYQRRWNEMSAWLVVAALFAALMAYHSQMVSAQLQPGDLTSGGWLGLQGWAGFVDVMSDYSLFGQLPIMLFAAMLALSFVGWSILSPARGMAVMLGYFGVIAIFARPDNSYWSLNMLPALLAGLAYAPKAISAHCTGRSAFKSGESFAA
ncbi:hypothetical protein AMC99_01794 [Altererythrobacter epoxidivorans]|uniref:Glycosyltransferase RgtA/B/C/D-like domain-containing protein n=1 Tax=Altererythrobacter epoxidivorans TaxID=361183 RepID=A0A0M4LVY3_9SPHN|nr:hypothetical protein [Altererythrobacter epoxidivorans]ALE17084.1 hypothetical protein AMC99_01794 [Altererythrobacter epoxidivorans]